MLKYVHSILSTSNYGCNSFPTLRSVDLFPSFRWYKSIAEI